MKNQTGRLESLVALDGVKTLMNKQSSDSDVLGYAESVPKHNLPNFMTLLAEIICDECC